MVFSAFPVEIAAKLSPTVGKPARLPRNPMKTCPPEESLPPKDALTMRGTGIPIARASYSAVALPPSGPMVGCRSGGSSSARAVRSRGTARIMRAKITRTALSNGFESRRALVMLASFKATCRWGVYGLYIGGRRLPANGLSRSLSHAVIGSRSRERCRHVR